MALSKGNFEMSVNQSERKAQVVKQCLALGHLVGKLATIIEHDNAQIVDPMVEAVGAETAHQLQSLCLILGSLDGIDVDNDALIQSVVEMARKMWPASSKWQCR